MESCKFRNHPVGPKTYRMRHPVFVSHTFKSGSFKVIGPDNCRKEIVKSRAPDVRLTCWLVHSAYSFKTKSSSILLMLKSSQIIVFWHFEGIKRFKKTRFFKVEAARRATGTKLTFVYFQKMHIFLGRGRPQGNGDKTDLRLFKQITTFSRSRPAAGQRGQHWKSCLKKKQYFPEVLKFLASWPRLF